MGARPPGRPPILPVKIRVLLLALASLLPACGGCQGPLVPPPPAAPPIPVPPPAEPLPPLPPTPPQDPTPPTAPPAEVLGALERITVGATVPEATAALALGEPAMVPAAPLAPAEARWTLRLPERGSWLLVARLTPECLVNDRRAVPIVEAPPR